MKEGSLQSRCGLPWQLPFCPFAVQVEAPPFLHTIAQQLLHAGQQLRLLAGLPEHITGDLVAQLTASAATEAEEAAAAAASDPWAAGAASGEVHETEPGTPCLLLLIALPWGL